MTKRNSVMIGVAVATLLVAGGLFASNMGFKLNYTLDSAGTNGSNSGTQTIALPYNQQTGLSMASDLRTDINATVPGSVLSISKYLSTSDTLQSYTGTSSATDFALAGGEGYLVQVSSDVNYIVVGSHDPGRVISLDSAGTNGSASGTQLFAHPYHTTAAMASDLRTEINNAAGSSAIISISKYLSGTDTLQSYTGTSSATDFALVPGEAELIQVGADVSVLPGHF